MGCGRFTAFGGLALFVAVACGSENDIGKTGTPTQPTGPLSDAGESVSNTAASGGAGGSETRRQDAAPTAQHRTPREDTRADARPTLDPDGALPNAHPPSDAAAGDPDASIEVSSDGGITAAPRPAPPFADAADGDAADAGSACDRATALVATRLAQEADPCAIAVRLEFMTAELLGYQLICGPHDPMDEAAALALVSSGQDPGTWQPLHPPNPKDAYVFYESPLDFGAVAAVSVRTGLPVFAGSIVWSGQGSVWVPSAFFPPEELGENCPWLGSPPPLSYYDLTFGDAYWSPWPNEGPFTPPSGIGAVLQTVLPAAIARDRTWLDSVELIYPPSVGGFSPSVAELVVILNVSGPGSIGDAGRVDAGAD